MQTDIVYDPVFVRIDKLLNNQGKQQKELIDFLAMARNTYGNWKTQKNKSYMKHIDEIADFFGVSPNYLIRGEDNPNHYSSHEEEIIRLFRKLSAENADVVYQIIKSIAQNNI